jgi:hypothetical protein
MTLVLPDGLPWVSLKADEVTTPDLTTTISYRPMMAEDAPPAPRVLLWQPVTSVSASAWLQHPSVREFLLTHTPTSRDGIKRSRSAQSFSLACLAIATSGPRDAETSVRAFYDRRTFMSGKEACRVSCIRKRLTLCSDASTGITTATSTSHSDLRVMAAKHCRSDSYRKPTPVLNCSGPPDLAQCLAGTTT